MHKYLIELMKYTEGGVPTNEYKYEYADTPQVLAEKVEKYNRMRYSVYDEQTGETKIGFKMFKVTPKQATYTNIDDFNAFVEMNGVLYHG